MTQSRVGIFWGLARPQTPRQRQSLWTLFPLRWL